MGQRQTLRVQKTCQREGRFASRSSGETGVDSRCASDPVSAFPPRSSPSGHVSVDSQPRVAGQNSPPEALNSLFHML